MVCSGLTTVCLTNQDMNMLADIGTKRCIHFVMHLENNFPMLTLQEVRLNVSYR
jgi:hypothetical protein